MRKRIALTTLLVLLATSFCYAGTLILSETDAIIAILVFILTVYLTTLDFHNQVETSEEQSAPQTLDDSNTQSQTTLESSLHENRPDL